MSGPWHAMMIHRRVTEGVWIEIPSTGEYLSVPRLIFLQAADFSG